MADTLQTKDSKTEDAIGSSKQQESNDISLIESKTTIQLRVAFIHPDLGIGGAERLVVDAAVGLQSRGHKVTMYTSHHDCSHCFEETRDGTLNVHVFGDWLPRSFFGKGGMILFAILRSLYLAMALITIHRNDYDILFVDQLSFSIPILKLTGAKILFYCHFPDKLLTQRDSLIKRVYRIPFDIMEELTTKMADKVVVNSNFTASVFNSSFQTMSEKPGVLYPGIRLDAYDRQVDTTDVSVKPLISKCITIISINRFERKKNIGLAIRAFALLSTHVPKYYSQLRLIIAGGYDVRVSENVEYMQELQALAQELGLAIATLDGKDTLKHPSDAQVIFLPSFSEAQRTFILSTSLCLVYTPVHEHFGIVPIEAMYAQLPVVAANNGGPTESILHNATGILCDAEPDSFSRSIALLVKDKNKAKAMGKLGRERVTTKFSLETFTKSLEHILFETMESDNMDAVMTSYVVYLTVISLTPVFIVTMLYILL
ncbi:hypothetical protein BATDEDRAFT_8038 [Batrachochytrium dendrobatidis JAM81]|uniref:Alpha-1,3/1,6-mannosyltransferase ALG2 n=1 Tax=Batrachochytrium dendrobatidis (strain JAM81 / FGSC 10211) TaxID=684364 RepID=F4NRU1_BATDJ|nr:uncharacterized protein BATDEDRAFT_8038 [Batrachochytrium dendrobatidis JAM81]EGF83375.1 hypothetical protein BATDEDRAFT_8038 [Batrachochytrium dendrobatidis JAM81]|eukprot:XP_006674963.1 hypothetical protein BATDEDRAFT_8038 [Batrachochytrium dendrobatidis JAM81]